MKKSKSFGGTYSKYYDLIYLDKDYEKECDFIEEIFRRYSPFKPTRILDAGCGTGGHLLHLARRGYEVVGIDKSKTMVQVAEEKIRKHKLRARVLAADVLNFNFKVKFDACISMFAVINYIVQTNDLIKAFKNIRNNLKQGALFIFDFWYGPAVLTIKPSSRIKIVEKEGVKVIRTVMPELDIFNHIQKVNYYLLAIKNGKVLDETHEVHTLRFLFPQELVHYLNDAGFQVLKFCEFPYLNNPPSEQTWNVAAVAVAQ